MLCDVKVSQKKNTRIKNRYLKNSFVTVRHWCSGCERMIFLDNSVHFEHLQNQNHLVTERKVSRLSNLDLINRIDLHKSQLRFCFFLPSRSGDDRLLISCVMFLFLGLIFTRHSFTLAHFL